MLYCQNEQLLNNRRNVILSEEMKRQEDEEKIILRTMYQADGTEPLFCMIFYGLF